MAEGGQASDRSSTGNPLSDEDDMTHLDVEDMSLEAVPKSKIPVQSDDSSSYEKDSSVSYYDALPRDEGRHTGRATPPCSPPPLSTILRSDEDSEANVQDEATKYELARSEISGQYRQDGDSSSGKGFDLAPDYGSYYYTRPATHLPRQGPDEIIFDMKNGTPEITEGTLGRLHGKNEDNMFEAPIKSKSAKVFVIAAKQTDRYLLVQGEHTTKCIRLQPETTQQQIVETAFPENHGNMSDDVISESLLRLEVARVTEAKPEGLEILVSKKKLDAKLNIQQVLHNNCIVSVEVKQESPSR
ncbi:hypothetical protein C0Q70_03008 [Pomacea canaliculata]|uniref:Uncharacterized protein n=1 Tax=Pomacea canaliculata TaxID=400727 RepID=A0A2T7PRJ4_POMCA|nr:hypothetical protein C0Q70_03008 [Pomacea canaliculata]